MNWPLIISYLGGLITGFAVGIEFRRWQCRRMVRRAADKVERRMRTGDQANMNERTPTGF